VARTGRDRAEKARTIDLERAERADAIVVACDDEVSLVERA